MTGWKVGWASGPAELVARLRAVKQFLTFAGGTPLQHAAAAALALPDEVAGELAASLRAQARPPRRRAARRRLRRAAPRRPPTSSTPTAPRSASTTRRRCASGCRVEAGVVAIPTSAFAADPNGPTRSLMRFAFPKSDEVLEEAAPSGSGAGRASASKPE